MLNVKRVQNFPTATEIKDPATKKWARNLMNLLDVNFKQIGTKAGKFNDIITKGPRVDVRAFGAKGDGSDDSTAINAGIAAGISGGLPVYFPDAIYAVEDPITIAAAVTIIASKDVTIQLTAAETALLDVTGKLTVKGGLTLDANSNADNCLYCNTDLPELHSVIFKNSNSYCLTNDQSNATGVCILDQCEYVNCVTGPHILGDGTIASEEVTGATTSVYQLNCRSSGTSGSGGNIYFFTAHEYVEVRGGNFEGHADGATNIYLCESSNIIGGHYKGIRRGPTIGKSSLRFTIVGTVCENIAIDTALAPAGAIAIDCKKEDNSCPDIYGIVADNVMIGCNRPLYCNAEYISVLGNISIGHTNETYAAFTFDGVRKAFVDGNAIYSTVLGGVYKAMTFGTLGVQHSTVRFGKNRTDSTHQDAWCTADVNNVIEFSQVTSHSASGDITTADDVLLVDCTTGVIDLDLPPKNIGNTKGKTWKIVKTDSSANNVSLTVQGGSDYGKINGVDTYLFGAGNQYAIAIVISLGDGDYLAYEPPSGTGQTYIETNVTTDRAFDADTVAVAELADVVGTLIVDLRARGIVK